MKTSKEYAKGLKKNININKNIDLIIEQYDRYQSLIDKRQQIRRQMDAEIDKVREKIMKSQPKADSVE